LRLVDQQSFDLVLTDAVMPGMSGPELCAHLRRMRPELRVILMSGYSEETSHSDALPSGVQRLRKPFTTPDLSRALRTALEYAPNSSPA
jgi:two-component system cell cycle sensor histidine kinase/response regulator CckA